MWRLSVLAAVLGALVLTGAGTALAEPPSRLAERVTDRAAVLGPDQVAQVEAAVDRLSSTDRIDLFVVYVTSFDGASGQDWADRTATLSQLGDRDVLLAVAVQDRAYGISVPEGFPLQQSLVDDVEARLADSDWSGAAITLADGLGASGGSGALPLVGAVVGGVVLIGGGAYLLTRRRRARPAQQDAPRDEFTDVPTEELAYRASATLIAVDDAVRTSEQELAAARAHFGDEAVAEFTAALEQSRAEMLQAFALRQRLDDDEPESEPEQRALYGEIIRIASAADSRLDAQVEAFDALRALEARAAEYIAGLAARHAAVSARLPQVDAAWTALRARYAASALEPVAGDLDQSKQLLAAAGGEITEARTALASGPGTGVAHSGEPPAADGATAAAQAGTASVPQAPGRPGPSAGTSATAPSETDVEDGSANPSTGPAAAVVSGRAAEDALTEAEQLLDGIGRRETELAAAAARIPAARAEVQQDLAEARALGSLVPVVARAEAALAAAEQSAAGPQPDPLAALRLIDEARTALDHGIAEAREAQERARRASAALAQALLTARSAIAAASDFITTRRGAVGVAARTRLAEAQRHLQRAEGPDPVAALREAQQADALAQEALRLARADVAQWSPGSGGELPGDLASLVLGGILAGASRGYRGGSGGFRSRSTGSFGGSSRRGRRSVGGRF